jgi:ankyrin repeat protein
LEVNIFPIFWKEAHHYILVSYGSNVIFMQDDDGDNAFHIAAETAKMIRENLDWLIVMLKNPDADIEVRNHRYVTSSQLKKLYFH